MIKVYFQDDSWWDGVGCSCCEPTYFETFNFSHIEGVECPTDYESYDYEMFNGSKSGEWECLVSVFWDLVADKSKYEDFYDLYYVFENIEEADIKHMLSDKGIEVVFLER